MIRIYSHKIEHQPKNKNLFVIMITLKKAKTNHAIYFPTKSLLKYKIKKKLLKTINELEAKKSYLASG